MVAKLKLVDRLDRRILVQIAGNPMTNMRQVAVAFDANKRTIRMRSLRLAEMGYIHVEQMHAECLLTLTQKGLQEIEDITVEDEIQVTRRALYGPVTTETIKIRKPKRGVII